MNKRSSIILVLLLGSSALLVASSEEEALRKFRQYAQEGDPVLRGSNLFKRRTIDPVAAAAEREELRRILDEMKNDPTANPKHILADIAHERKIEIEEAAQKEIDDIKWQNTLLVSDPSGLVGIYKSDFIKSGLLIASIVADVKLYNELTRRRKEHIIDAMLSDIDMFIALLKRVNESEARYDERMASMSAFAQVFTDRDRGRDILLNPLRRYLVENHTLVKGYMPFTSETIVPLVARWGLEKLFVLLEKKLLVRTRWADVWEDIWSLNVSGLGKRVIDPRFQENFDARRFAYQPNQAGHLVPLKTNVLEVTEGLGIGVPFSFTTALKTLMFIVNPIKALQKLLYPTTSTWLGGLSLANKVSGFGLPDFLFSDAAKFGLEVVSIGFSAKYYDMINTSKWGTYVLQNRDELLRILYGYRRALDNASSGEDAIAQAKQGIRDFVEQGHESTGLIPGASLDWWKVRAEGRGYVHKWLRYGAATLLALKFGHWWLTAEPKPQ